MFISTPDHSRSPLLFFFFLLFFSLTLAPTSSAKRPRRPASGAASADHPPVYPEPEPYRLTQTGAFVCSGGSPLLDSSTLHGDCSSAISAFRQDPANSDARDHLWVDLGNAVHRWYLSEGLGTHRARSPQGFPDVPRAYHTTPRSWFAGQCEMAVTFMGPESPRVGALADQPSPAPPKYIAQAAEWVNDQCVGVAHRAGGWTGVSPYDRLKVELKMVTPRT